MVTREQPSEDIFDTLNPTLHQYFDLASQTLEAPQPILDDIIANEERYEQGVLINQGGMKKILKITDALTGRPVAMGQLHDPENPQKVERFLREARLTAALEHPNIIPVYDIGVTAEGDPFFTMKLVGGRSLSKILKALGDKDSNDRFSYQDLMNIFIKICDAMAYAHSKGILHLDLKPENIRVGDFGEVLVCDWGLAKVIDSPEEDIDIELDPCLYNDITLDGVIKGTPGFMAPEQVDFKLGEKDKRTDVYALGGILYSMLAMKPPIDNKDVQKTLDQTIVGEIKPPSLTAPPNRDVSLSLEAVAMKALQLNQNDRYQSVADLRNEIYKWMGGFATDAENAGFAKALWLLLKRHKAVSALLLIIIISSIFAVIKIKENENRATEALALYEDEKKQTEIIGREASPRLVYLSKQALNSFEFSKALKMADRAIDRDPKNLFAHAMKAMTHFFRQEFNLALESFKLSGKFQKQNPYKKMIAICQEFAPSKPDESLLNSKDFISVLKKFEDKPEIYKLFRYASSNFTSLEDHITVCKFMLQHNNPQVKKWNFKFTYNDESISLKIAGNRKMTNIGCLRGLPIDHLDLSNTEAWQEWVLAEMPLVELNIKNTKFKDIREILKIKTLQKLILSKRQFPGLKLPKDSELVIVRK